MRIHFEITILMLITITCGLISCISNTASNRNDYIGIWRSTHDAGGNTLEINSSNLKYTRRTCTAPDEVLTCKWTLNDGWLVIQMEEKNERYKLIKSNDKQFLIGEYYFKEYHDKLPDYVFENEFKKQ